MLFWFEFSSLAISFSTKEMGPFLRKRLACDASSLRWPGKMSRGMYEQMHFRLVRVFELIF